MKWRIAPSNHSVLPSYKRCEFQRRDAKTKATGNERRIPGGCEKQRDGGNPGASASLLPESERRRDGGMKAGGEGEEEDGVWGGTG